MDFQWLNAIRIWFIQVLKFCILPISKMEWLWGIFRSWALQNLLFYSTFLHITPQFLFFSKPQCSLQRNHLNITFNLYIEGCGLHELIWIIKIDFTSFSTSYLFSGDHITSNLGTVKLQVSDWLTLLMIHNRWQMYFTFSASMHKI